MLKAPSGRIYIFYNHNTDNVREIPADPCEWFPDGVCRRVDSLGHFVFKYSDDHGRTWSAQRYPIPVRDLDIDRRNPFGGKLRFFWNVGKPFVHAGTAFVSLHKVGGFGEGFFTRSEGVLLKSANLLTERTRRRSPGRRCPTASSACARRPAAAPSPRSRATSCSATARFMHLPHHRRPSGRGYSRDGGHTWTPPQYRRYADGRLMKHPRAANFAWKCENGKYLYWFHNHGGRFIGEHPGGAPSPTRIATRSGCAAGSRSTRRTASASCGRSRRSCSTTTTRSSA